MNERPVTTGHGALVQSNAVRPLFTLGAVDS